MWAFKKRPYLEHMSIEVNQLTKVYGQQKAIDSLNFTIDTGQVVGFLGPNGAGKTTTMKILTSFIPPSSGSAKVCGFDVESQSMEARRQIGYLPEHNPLYLDLYVREYLDFAAGLHKLGKNKKSRIDEMIEVTGLERESGKKIGQLSKGYRQRVGLAQAMLHDPQVLILDEPTSGLDPNQLADIRALIISLGKQKTVILSTHIMQEVQAMTDRVLIINNGQLVADDTATALQSRVSGSKSYLLEFQQSVSPALLEAIEGVAEVRNIGNGQWRVFGSNNEDIRSELFKFAVRENLVLLTMQMESGSIEDVFRELTSSQA